MARSSTRLARRARLSFDQLEDRVVPATAFALLPSNSLISFDTDNAATVNAPITITGLGVGENLVGIDFRPQNGLLYGLTSSAAGGGSVRLYAISQRTGVATPLSTTAVQFTDAAGAAVPITGTNFGFDFNPVADRIRVTSDTGFNFRINPNTGALIDGDGVAGNPVTPDAPINGSTTMADASGYTNSSPNATATTLYHLDATTNTLFQQVPPNSGTTSDTLPVTLNGAPLDFTGVNGFDIPSNVIVAASNDDASGRAFASLTTATDTRLYGIELSTGVATDLGLIAGGTEPYNGLAIQSVQPGTGVAGTPLIGFSNIVGLGTLTRFNSAAPAGGSAPALISGLQNLEVLVGFDFRPATGQLFGLGINEAANTGTLYLIDPQTGPTGTPSATPVGAVGGIAFLAADGTTVVDLPADAVGYGFDFNPTVDRIRVTTGSGLNFRLNPNDGSAIDGDGNAANGNNPDANINGSGSTGVMATAYTNSFGQFPGGPTTQYTIDTATDTLQIQFQPNSGTQTNPLPITVNGAAVDFTAVNGFDIPAGVRVTASGEAASGFGFAALSTATDTRLYRIDLATGAATDLGLIGTGASSLAGLTAADTPTGTVAFSSATYTVAENGGTATVTLTRTAGSTGAFTVMIASNGGSTTAGDFGAIPSPVAFADGQTSATVQIPITDDALFEGDETIVLTLSAPTNGAVLGAPATATLTITDNEVSSPAAGTIGFSSPTYSVTEGSPTATITLTRTGGSMGATTVTLTATGGTATPGADFGTVPTPVTFADGQTTATVQIPIVDDALNEGSETVVLTLSGPTGGANLAAQSTATLTIVDNEVANPAAGTIRFTSPVFAVAEGTMTATVSLTRTGGTLGAVSVTVSATGGSATPGADFGTIPTPVSFADGQTTATVQIPISDDAVFEGAETVELTLSAATGGANLGAPALATLTIADNEVSNPAAGTIGFSSPAFSVTEGTPNATVTLTRTGGSTGTATVVVTATGGTATPGTDFGAVPTPVTFADGQTTATVQIPIVNDALVEGNETVVLTLSGPTGGANLAAQSTSTLTIVDNDPVGGGAGPGPGIDRILAASGSLDGRATVYSSASGQFGPPTRTPAGLFPGFTGNVRVATADVNGDTILDSVLVTGPGSQVRVAVVSGLDNSTVLVAPFDPFNDPRFTGGGFVAAADLDGDGRAELVVSPDLGGGPRVAIFSRNADGSITTRVNFFGIDDAEFRGGVRVALGDVNRDGASDLAVAAGFGGGPRVALFNGLTLLTTPTRLVNDFFAFPGPDAVTLRNGAYVGLGDVDGDDFADLIFGGGPGGAPRVFILSGALVSSGAVAAAYLAPVGNFFVADNSASRGGIRVAAIDSDGDDRADVAVGSGENEPSRVRVYAGSSFPVSGEPTAFQDLDPFQSVVLTDGVYVG